MESESLIILPTYNEIQNIEKLINEIRKWTPEISILVIDDNSPDGTGDHVEKLIIDGAAKLDLIRRSGKLGLGTAYIRGFKYALEKGYEYVFEMDADFSHNPSYLPKFLEAIKDADLVIGSRYIPGGGVKNWSAIREYISKGGSLYSRILLSLPYMDLTGGFKCFRAKTTLAALALDDIKSEGYSFQIEVTYRASKLGMRIKEIPIVFEERAEGKSKMSNKIILEAVYRVWQMRYNVI